MLWAAGCDSVGYFWWGRDIFQGETNKVVSRVVLPVKQPEFKVFGRDVGDRMTAVAQRERYGGGFAPTPQRLNESFSSALVYYSCWVITLGKFINAASETGVKVPVSTLTPASIRL